MSEEEIIKIIKYMLENRNTDINIIINYEAIQGLLDLYTKQQKEIEELKEMKPLQDLIDTNIIIADYSHNYISKDKIREIIGKYIDIQEHKKYTNQELYGEDLKNMINELLEEER